MSRRPLRIATTPMFERSVREAGFDAYLLPDTVSLDFNRSIEERTRDGAVYRPFLEEHDIDLVLDCNTQALTLVASPSNPGEMALTTASLGIPYVSCYLDPVTSTMAQVGWADHWHLLESNTWIKWIPEATHAEELMKLGVGSIVTMPMAVVDDDYDTSPPPQPESGPPVAFMGHPASSWFGSEQQIMPRQLCAGLMAAGVRADMPDLPFHKIFYDLYEFATPPKPSDDRMTRATRSSEYYAQKFVYQAYLALKHRDRFIRFLKLKLGDSFELIGDFWGTQYGLPHTPRIWDMKKLHERMRAVPINLNFIKGNWETGLIVRHFEVPAHGGFMLTYETGELSKNFEIGKECDVFHNEEELLDKIHFYLQHPEERREIAAAGQRRVLAEHLYSHRITTLVELLRKANVLPKIGMAAAAPESALAAPAMALAGITLDADACESPPMSIPKIHVAGVIDPTDA